MATVNDMGWNDRVPQDRATAQIVIVFGGIVIVLSVLLLFSIIANGDPGHLSRRGIPVWLLTVLAAAFGGWLIWKGVAIWRADERREK
ncbi:hypothetical protein [Microbacterium sp. MM2322]|uniref:hypothetical protein n=1 Tax=Microbacterium sp. MM2322 TaxID=3157631 RepID=UPI0032D57E4D